jgi:Mg/Co/Ni transporter MgtE
VRRLPIVDKDGQLVGIVSIDDLLEVLAEEFSELAKIMAREQARETSGRR